MLASKLNFSKVERLCGGLNQHLSYSMLLWVFFKQSFAVNVNRDFGHNYVVI